jgi:hypothetical protein
MHQGWAGGCRSAGASPRSQCGVDRASTLASALSACPRPAERRRMERRRAPSAERTSAGGGDPLQQVWEAPRSLGSASGGRQRSRGLAASMTVTGSRLGPASGMHGRRALGRREGLARPNRDRDPCPQCWTRGHACLGGRRWPLRPPICRRRCTLRQYSSRACQSVTGGWACTTCDVLLSCKKAFGSVN